MNWPRAIALTYSIRYNPLWVVRKGYYHFDMYDKGNKVAIMVLKQFK